MTIYKAPQKEFLFLLRDVFNYPEMVAELGVNDAGMEMVESILPQAARFFEEVLAPTNMTADKQGSAIEGDDVKTAPVLDGIYQQLIDAGWASISGDTEYGGAGFPELVNLMIQEMIQTANVSFSLLPTLTQGVVHAIRLYASDEQKATYLENLVTGKWSGTMNLTEPQAGTDLGAIKTRAVPEGDHYRITGQKIFITWGDHQQAENIIHLVLAKTPDALEGTKGISMFIVPKYLLNEDGTPGERNDMKPVGVEHKMGIHASPTCTLQYGDNGGAIGYLVGEENKGIVYMFTMMNAARLLVGHQGISVSERAYQQAVAYAGERVQGQVASEEPNAPIICHPDVKRMLLQMRALTEAGRALSFAAIVAVDYSHNHPDESVRAENALIVDVLTPLVKGWCTECGVEVSSLGVQVHGGTGYIEETGAAQHFRDARIMPIYEGTNGIQALDFIGRKTLADGGAGVTLVLKKCLATIRELAEAESEIAAMRDKLGGALEQCQTALKSIAESPQDAPAVAFNYMMLVSNTLCGWMMLRSAVAAQLRIDSGETDRIYPQKVATASFFLDFILPRNTAYLAGVTAGVDSLVQLNAEDFARE